MSPVSLNRVGTMARSLSQNVKPVISTVSHAVQNVAPEVTEKLNKKGVLETLKKIGSLAKTYGKTAIDFVVKYGQKAWEAICKVANSAVKFFSKSPAPKA